MKVGIDQIVSVDPNTLELSLTPQARSIDVFKAIILRDKGSEGDSQARKKLRAISEICYCYLMEKYGTPFYRFEESKRHSEVCKRLKIDIDENDELILDLRDFLRISQITPSFEALNVIKESYHSSTNMLKMMKKLLENMLIDLQGNLTWNPDEEENNDKLLNNIKQANQLLKDIKGNVMDFDAVLKLIASLEEKVKEEQVAKEKQIKGGGQVLKYEN